MTDACVMMQKEAPLESNGKGGQNEGEMKEGHRKNGGPNGERTKGRSLMTSSLVLESV